MSSPKPPNGLAPRALRRLLAGLVAAGSIGCARSAPPPVDWAAVDRELLARGAEDQRIRDSVFSGGGAPTLPMVEALRRVDTANTRWLSELVDRHGWPRTPAVSRRAIDVAFLIVQHATEDTAFMRRMLPEVEAARARGDLGGQEVALLTDRLLVKSGRPQRYGTQLSWRDGGYRFDPIEDSAHVDERRRAIGLPTLAEYLRVIDSVYRKPPSR